MYSFICEADTIGCAHVCTPTCINALYVPGHVRQSLAVHQKVALYCLLVQVWMWPLACTVPCLCGIVAKQRGVHLQHTHMHAHIHMHTRACARVPLGSGSLTAGVEFQNDVRATNQRNTCSWSTTFSVLSLHSSSGTESSTATFMIVSRRPCRQQQSDI